MTKTTGSLVFCLFICILTFGQDKIESDRPDQTETAVTVPEHFFQAELGFLYESTKNRDYDVQHPTGLFKYGVSKNFELRLEAELATEYRHLIPNPSTTTGLEPVQIGFKAGLIEEKGIIPKTSVIAQFAIPTLASKDFKADHVAPIILLAMKNTISETLDIGYNLGAEWDGFSTQPQYIYSVSLGIELSDCWNVFAEPYGFIQKNAGAQMYFDGGVQYYISNNVKADASAGVGLSEASSDYFISTGISFRIH